MTTPLLSGSEPKVPKMAAQGPMAIAMRLRNQLQSVYKLDPLRNEEEVKLKIKELNEHIVCYLCARATSSMPQPSQSACIHSVRAVL
ncbi:hypothetical protein AAFF_G00418100 [Aldrovandia affinis]|uniref:Uncharacterized protein n=1 Tax=Aldrovandia affinis TaxID=143900 RepID=A0AAD7SAS4_9TELE|nr:hypothetical protein AAFF_G00418100 [Aldrovandia affinis]